MPTITRGFLRAFFTAVAALLLTACATHAERVTTSEAASSDEAPKATAHAATPADQATPKSPDIWDRIRSGFALPGHDHARIEDDLRWYAAHPAYIDRVTRRAEPYLHHIVSQLEARGMPLEIALLPVVESAYNPFAYSYGRAAGIWQFIPATGRRYGLKQNWWYDGRRDVLASTEAALNYLSRLYEIFDGDWLLALAAYNSGEGTVKAAMRRNQRAGKPVDFWSLRLPRETQHYVPKLLALATLVEQPDRFGLTLHSIPDQAYFEVVEVDSQIDLALAAELAGLSLEEIYRLNPGFNRWATDPDGPHRILVPSDRAEAFTANLHGIDPSQRIQWARHKVKRGETLSHIAQRYRTTVDMIRRVNALDDHMVRAGAELIIPVASQDLDQYVLSVEQRLLSTQNTQHGTYQITHTVTNGDTLWDLARKYDVNVQELARWNGMAPADLIHPGQQLVIWGNSTSLVVAASANVPVQRQRVHYTVRSGDSLSRISQRFNVTVTDIRRWNALDGQKYLQPGQMLLLYVDVTEQSST